MRKLSLVLILLGTSALSFATPNPTASQIQQNLATTGFYLSAGISATSFGAQNNIIALGADYLRNDYINNVRKTRQDINGMLAIGYDVAITPTFLLGIETRLIPQSLSLHTTPDQVIWSTDEETVVAQSDNKINIDANSAQLLLKPEFLVDTNQYVYALVGTGYSRETLTSSVRYNSTLSGNTTIPQMQVSTTVFPIIYGLGYTQFFLSNLSFYGEVTDIYYPNITTQKSFATGAATPLVIQSSSVTINALAATIGLTYHFNGF